MKCILYPNLAVLPLGHMNMAKNIAARASLLGSAIGQLRAKWGPCS